ncbi:hypothetical protein D3C84_963790 [compost metagenome]
MGNEIDQVAPVVALDRYFAGFDRLAALLGLEQGGADFQAQLRKNQGQQIARQFTADMPQETPGTFAHVQDVGIGIDNHARWCGLFQGPLMDIGDGQLTRQAVLRRLPGNTGAHVAPAGHGRGATAIGRAGFGAEDPVTFVYWSE